MSRPPKPRVVSLLSSATEILDSLGGISLLVGRSHECDYPPEVLALPQCTRPLIDVNADSRSIDEQVKNSSRNQLSIYQVFDEVLERLQPTHILTQIQCDVCAVSVRDVERSIASRLESHPEIVSLNPTCLGEIWQDFYRIGDVLGLDSAACVGRLKREMRSSSANQPGPSVACIEWIEPLMAAGNWTPELIELAGGRNLFGDAGKHSPWMTWEELIDADPDITIVAPCGFDLARAEREIQWLTGKPGFGSLRRVCLADGQAWFNRPGPRIVETLKILNEIFYASGNEFENRAWKWVK